MNLLIENGKRYDGVDFDDDAGEVEIFSPAVLKLHLPGTSMSWVLSHLRSDVGLAFGAAFTKYAAPAVGHFDLADLEALRSCDGHAIEVEPLLASASVLELMGQAIQATQDNLEARSDAE